MPLVRKVSHRENQFGLLDGQEIIRDEATGRIVDGRELFLLVCSNEATKQLLKGATFNMPSLGVDELSELT